MKLSATLFERFEDTTKNNRLVEQESDQLVVQQAKMMPLRVAIMAANAVVPASSYRETSTN